MLMINLKKRVNKIVRISICLMKMVVANDDHSIDWYLIDYWSSDRAIGIHTKWTCKPQNISFLRTCASRNSSINVQVYCGDIGLLPPIKWVPTICTPAMRLFSISKIIFHESIGRDAPKTKKTTLENTKRLVSSPKTGQTPTIPKNQGNPGVFC